VWVRCAFEDGALHCSLGCDDELIGRGVHAIPLPFAFQHGGTALTIGYDRGFPVCDDYEPPFPWTGRISDVTLDTGQPGIDLDQVRTALHSD
jgi:arylsulfatase